MNDFYTYAYLREDKTPYYIGKGTGRRIYSTNRKGLKPPKDKSRIIFLKQNLTEEEAFKHEVYMIAVFGRKDNGTGILRNKTDGGDGISGFTHSEETKNKMSASAKLTSEQRSEIARKRQASRTPEQRSEAGRKAYANKTPEQRSEASRKASSQMFQCSVTGYITNAGGLSMYQKARGIDTSKRKKLSE